MTMREKIKQYYQNRVKNDDPNSLLWQVGKTVNGKEVSREQVELIIQTIVGRLKLGKTDIVIDIGCGNGLLTREISEYVSEVTGLELTPELYVIAKEYNSAENISYVNSDVLDIDTARTGAKFTKVYLYEVIQHLDYREADTLFAKLNDITADNATIFIGGVLDVEKKWMFFDTEERRCMYFTGLLSGCDSLGTWYHRDFFNFLAKKHNLYAECIAQESKLYTSHYRFDCLLRRK